MSHFKFKIAYSKITFSAQVADENGRRKWGKKYGYGKREGDRTSRNSKVGNSAFRLKASVRNCNRDRS